MSICAKQTIYCNSIMTYEELQKEIKKLERQERMCFARQVKARELYKKQNAPMKLRKYERIKVRLRVTEETRKHLVASELTKRKNQVGYEYTVVGCFDGWYIHEDGHGELKPCFFRGPSYSRFDDVIGIESAEQIDGHCSKCKMYKEGLCYMIGCRDLGKKYAHHKVEDDDCTCPLYEEVIELWDKYEGGRYPNVTVLKHEKPLEYRIYSQNWKYYTKYSQKDVELLYCFENPNKE